MGRLTRRSPRAGSRKQYVSTREIDSLIRQGYLRLRKLHDRSALTKVGRQLGWPAYMVSRRGAELGLSFVREKRWSRAEVRILEQHQCLGPDAIQNRLHRARYHRSRTAILLKRRQLGLVQKGYSAYRLAELLGTSRHRVVRWIQKGALRASRRGTARGARQGGDAWFIKEHETKRFLSRHKEAFEPAKGDRAWLAALTGASRSALTARGQAM
jgi:hypothetical protein